jgi:hypothetical protein
MKTLTFTFYSDPGHGWLKVPVKVIKSAGVAHLISSFSYIRGDYVYLEEDCDVMPLFTALTNQGYTPTVRAMPQSNKRSKIRSYQDYSATAIK